MFFDSLQNATEQFIFTLNSSMSLLCWNGASANVYKRRKLNSTRVAKELTTSPDSERFTVEGLSIASDIASVAVTDRLDELKMGSSIGDILLRRRYCNNYIVYTRRRIDSDAINGNCSSSRSNVVFVSANLGNENGKCRPVSPLPSGEMSEKKRCLSILRTNDFVRRYHHRKHHASKKYGCEHKLQCDISTTCSCKACILKMAKCADCDVFFHLDTFKVQEKASLKDIGLCQKCRMGKNGGLRHYDTRNSAKIMEVIRVRKSTSPIALMLRDTRPYVTKIRVGKFYQADVPEWIGPVNDSSDSFGEPLELSISTCTTFPVRPNPDREPSTSTNHVAFGANSTRNGSIGFQCYCLKTNMGSIHVKRAAINVYKRRKLHPSLYLNEATITSFREIAGTENSLAVTVAEQCINLTHSLKIHASKAHILPMFVFNTRSNELRQGTGVDAGRCSTGFIVYTRRKADWGCLNGRCSSSKSEEDITSANDISGS